MRSVGLDLGARHIAYCEMADGKIVRKGSVRRFSELKGVLLGPDSPPARVAFEACREGWYVHDTLLTWGHEPLMLDTTRVRQLGVGHHGRKNDAIDAEVIAGAVDAGRVRLAHVLSPARRALRAKLSVRGELVDMRSRQVTLIRGLARAAGTMLPSSATTNFLAKVQQAELEKDLRELIAPLVATLAIAEEHIRKLDAEIAEMVANDAQTRICATVPGVGVIVAASFVSVLDEAKRFRNANAVASYFGLAPGESTTGGPGNRRLGGITKQGNTHARAMLVQAAWQILRAADADDPLRKWAEQVAERRGRKVAAVALARKLAGLMWAMCRDGTVYDAELVARSSAKGLHDRTQQDAVVTAAMSKVARKLGLRMKPKRRATTKEVSAA